MRLIRHGCLVFVLALVGLTATGSAWAAFPGQNGKIFFHACDVSGCGYDIYSVNPDGTDLRNLTEAFTAPPGAPDVAFDPSVSADGRRVAFGVDSQATAEIWIMDADGSNPRQLTRDDLLDQQPAISPDGSRIAWNQWSPFPTYGDRDIWVMNSDGAGQELLYNGGQTDIFSAFTPDGQTLVISSETGDTDIRKIPSIPAVPPLTLSTGVADDDALLESAPTVSPDGQRVAFTQTPIGMPGGPFDIYSVGIDGGPTAPVYNTAATETSPAYSPDGTKMAFSSDFVAMVGNADGSGTPVPLNIGALDSAGGFDWAPKQAVPPTNPPGVPPSPQSKIGKHPKKKTKKRKAKFTFSSDQAGATFECKLDRRRFKRCRSPFKRRVRLGVHTFKVRAISTAGVPDPTPAKFRWRVIRG